MKAIIVDDDEISLHLLEMECLQRQEIEVAGVFTNPAGALEYANGHPVEFALLDINMPEMSGIELANRLREIRPDMIVIFVSAYNGYLLDALKIKADYYVLKPYGREDMEDALNRAALLSQRLSRSVFIRTFGRFDVFAGGRLVKFKIAKSKELLAVCVDHMGGEVSMEEAVDKLWPDKDYDGRVKALYRRAVIGLRATLKEYGAPEIFCSYRGGCHLVESLVECDYYEFMKNGGQSRCLYGDEYMFDYSWAEKTNAILQSMKWNEKK